MSLTEVRTPDPQIALRRTTARALLKKKLLKTRITVLTAYDHPTASLGNEAGIDMILVGDPLAMAVLGYEMVLCPTRRDAEGSAMSSRTSIVPNSGSRRSYSSAHYCARQAVVQAR